MSMKWQALVEHNKMCQNEKCNGVFIQNSNCESYVGTDHKAFFLALKKWQGSVHVKQCFFFVTEEHLSIGDWTNDNWWEGIILEQNYWKKIRAQTYPIEDDTDQIFVQSVEYNMLLEYRVRYLVNFERSCT